MNIEVNARWKQELATLDQRIDDLEKELEGCRARRAEIEAVVYSNGETTVNNHRLPQETLARICALSHGTQAQRNRRMSLVCRSWREAVLTWPDLWNNINITIDAELRDVKKEWNYMQICVDRSGQTPLRIVFDLGQLPETESFKLALLENRYREILQDVSLDLDNLKSFVVLSGRSRDMREIYDVMIRQFVSRLRTQSHRWRSFHLTLRGHSAELTNDVLYLEHQDVSRLEDLTLSHVLGKQRTYPTVLHALPFSTLRSLNSDCRIKFARPPAFASTILRLRLDNEITAGSFLAVAGEEFTALEELSLVANSDTIVEKPTPAYFPALRDMTIHCHVPQTILAFINAPDLERLKLVENRRFTYPALERYPKVRSLGLLMSRAQRVSPPSEEEVVKALTDALRQLPIAETILISESSGDPTSMLKAALRPLKDNTRPFPKLWEIRFVRWEGKLHEGEVVSGVYKHSVAE